MQCPAGHENAPGATFCSTCGVALAAMPQTSWNPQAQAPAPTGYYQQAPRPANNGMGTAALVVGILSLLLCGAGGILAIVFGSIGLGRANRGEATNKGAATAGIILGAVAIVVWTFISIGIAASGGNPGS